MCVPHAFGSTQGCKVSEPCVGNPYMYAGWAVNFLCTALNTLKQVRQYKLYSVQGIWWHPRNRWYSFLFVTEYFCALWSSKLSFTYRRTLLISRINFHRCKLCEMKDESKFLCHNIKVMYIKCRQLLRWRLVIITSTRVGQTISAADNCVYIHTISGC